ncbi:Uncharacterised protein [Mycobacteroides abscessus subsp. abscessus]|nr:Uncharacterised protein [Mycobacteroides abscessus subsp. abscessus]
MERGGGVVLAGHRRGDAVAHPRHRGLESAEELTRADEVLPAGVDGAVEDPAVGDDGRQRFVGGAEALIDDPLEVGVGVLLGLGRLGEGIDPAGQGGDRTGQRAATDSAAGLGLGTDLADPRLDRIDSGVRKPAVLEREFGDREDR